jgi:hypothetical protein
MGVFSIKNGFSGIETKLAGTDTGANIGRPKFFYNFRIFSLLSKMLCGTLQLMLILNNSNLCVRLYRTLFAGWRERRMEG